MSFLYNTESTTIKLNTWFDVSSNTFYLFIPPYVEIKDLQLKSDESFELRRENGDGVVIPYSKCQEDILYRYVPKNGGQTDLRFCIKRLSSIHSLFIETESGTTKKIHTDKKIKENATLSLIDDKGTFDIYKATGKIKGRGRSTWAMPKKSYLFKSNDSINPMGMGAAFKWVLLSNSFDETNLRNKLAFNFAKEIGLSNSPDCYFVDLFLNGNYVGLYLLTEKVEFGKDRINDIKPPGFLFTLTSGDEAKKYVNVFNEKSGVKVALVEPENVDESEFSIIKNRLEVLDSCIKSGEQLHEIIDVDSWAMSYLVDELLANSDAGFLSTYFYTYGNVGLFYKGPVWDYDRSLGNTIRTKDPKIFSAGKKAVNTIIPTPYYYCLMQDSVFKKKVIEYYVGKVIPHVNSMLKYEIDSLFFTIEKSSIINSTRWRLMYENDELNQGMLPSNSISQIKVFLKKKVDFLNSAWIDGINYHTILLQQKGSSVYQVITLREGSILSDSLLNGCIYKYKDTEEVYLNKPIRDDCELVLVNDNEYMGLMSKMLGVSGIILFVVSLFIVTFIVSFIYVIFKNIL